MDLESIMRDDILNSEDDIPVDFKLIRTGQTVSGTMTPTTKNNDVSDLGTLNIADAVWVGITSKFTATDGVPVVDDVGEVDGVRYTVQNVTLDLVGIRLALRRT